MIRQASGPTVPWGVLTVILGVITLASLGTLVVVTSVKNIDTLATVALALAVVSFAAQLIVTMAQGQESAQVNSETKAALTEMRASTASLLTNQRDQFNSVLRALIQQAVPAAVEDVAGGEDGDGIGQLTTDLDEQSAELESALQSRLQELISPLSTTQTSAVSSKSSATSSSRQRQQQEWNDLMATYPSREEGEPVAEILRQLSPTSIATVGRLTADASKSKQLDRSVRYRRRTGAPIRGLQQLVDAGLLEVVDEPPEGEGGAVAFRFTPRGMIAARLLRSAEEPPEWAKDLGVS